MALLLEAPLKATLVLSTGTGSATNSRATAKRVFDNENVCKLARSSAVTFSGARLVQNYFANSGNMELGAEWTATNMTKTAALDPTGAAGGVLCTVTANLASYIRQSYNPVTLTGNVKGLKLLYKPGTATWVRILHYDGSGNQARFWVNMTTNVLGAQTVGGTGWAHVSTSLNPSTDYPGWYEVTSVITSPETGTYYVQIGPVDADNSILTTAINGLTFTLAFPQLENLTGQSVLTHNEYVSTGVLATPWHGAGVDGAKYFVTNKDLTAIPESGMQGVHLDPVAKTNTLLWCRDLTANKWAGSVEATELVTNGDFPSVTTGWTATNATMAIVAGEMEVTSTTTGSGQAAQSITLEYNTSYIFTGTARKGTAETSATIAIWNGVTQVNAVTDSAGAGTTTTYRFTTAASGTPQIKLTSNSTSIGKTAYFDNITLKKATIQPALTSTGITGQTNSCTLLTAGAADATILQTITAAAAAACSGFWMKRSVGTGTVSITRDGGSTWTDITSLLTTSSFTLVSIENTSVTNPSVGIKISTSGDAVIVDAGLNHLGTQICEPIFTTTANVTRNAEVLTYPTAANFSDTAGTILAVITRTPDWDTNHDGAIGSTTAGLGTLATNGGVKAVDGTNTVNGPAGSPVYSKNLAIRWSGVTLEALSEGVPGTAGTYDGAFGLATIGIGVGGIQNIKNVCIYDTALTNAEIATAFGIGGASMALMGVGK